MTSIIIVEDGTGSNPEANSYGDYAGLNTYASLRGLQLPTPTMDANPNLAAEQLLIHAMDYLENQEWIGNPQFPLIPQPLAWPRCWYVCGMPVVGIPAKIIQAQYMLACIVGTGVDLYPITTGPAVIKEVISVIEVDYSERNGTTGPPLLYQVDAMLRGYRNITGMQLLTAYRA